MMLIQNQINERCLLDEVCYCCSLVNTNFTVLFFKYLTKEIIMVQGTEILIMGQ